VTELDRLNRTIRVKKHLTSPAMWDHTLVKYLSACLRAIHFAESRRLYHSFVLPCGIRRTAGEIIAMFQLQDFVEWDIETSQLGRYEQLLGLGAPREETEDTVREKQVQLSVGTRVRPRGTTSG
jgi:hypothetical protein